MTTPATSSRTKSPGPGGAATGNDARSPRRLFALLLVGLFLVGVAWIVRTNPTLRENALRGKDLPELEALVKRQPDDALAQYYLARIYYRNRRFGDAQAAYETAARLDPDSARTRMGLALALLARGQPEPAREALEQAIRLDKRLAGAELLLGKLLWEQRRVTDALPHIQRAADLDPQNHVAWYGLTVCYTELRRFDEAIPPLEKALAIREADPKYHTALGELLVFRGDMAGARKHYERALEIDPDYGPACALAGSFFLSRVSGPEARARAEELLTRATRLKTLRPQQLYLDLGQLYVQKGEYARAVEALQKSIEADPRDERGYYALANAYRRLGDTRSAARTEADFKRISTLHIRMQSLQARVSHRPTEPSLRLELARVYRQLRLPADAARSYAAYLRLKPADSQVVAEYQSFLQQQVPNAAAESGSEFPLPVLPRRP